MRESSSQNALKAINAGELLPYYLCVGDEEVMAQRIRKALEVHFPESWQIEKVHAASVTADAVLQSACTMPLLGGKRLIVVMHADAWSAEHWQRIASYCAQPSPSAVLVLFAQRLDARSRIVKVAKAAQAWIELSTPKGVGLARWLRDEVSAQGGTIDRDALELLIATVGADTLALSQAVTQCQLYNEAAGEPSLRINKSLLHHCIAGLPMENIWHLLDAVSQRDTSDALRVAMTLMASRESAFGMLAMLIRQVRLLARFDAAMADGKNASEAAKKSGVPPFKAKLFAQWTRGIGRDRYAYMLAVLLQLERSLRSSRVPTEALVSQALFELCTLPEKSTVSGI